MASCWLSDTVKWHLIFLKRSHYHYVGIVVKGITSYNVQNKIPEDYFKRRDIIVLKNERILLSLGCTIYIYNITV